MIFVFGIVGFILGFAGGLAVINLFLQGYGKGELVKNKSLRWSYGVAVWVFAALGTLAGLWLYNRSFF